MVLLNMATNPFTGSPNLRELVRLSQLHCHMSCSIKNKDSIRTLSACGKTVVECRCHAKNCMDESGSFRFLIGSYSKVPVSHGFEGHDLAPPQGIFFTNAELQPVKEAKKKEMSHLVQGMKDNLTDKEEMEELEERHQVEIKVYKQKVKHLLYGHPTPTPTPSP